MEPEKVKSIRCILRAAASFWLISASVPAQAQQACWPILHVKQPRLSDTMINLKRYWFASLEVNASSCVESAGTFDLRTIRTAEYAPDFMVTEPIAWNTRQTDVVIELWADEAIVKHRIGRVRPCTCRS